MRQWSDEFPLHCRVGIPAELEECNCTAIRCLFDNVGYLAGSIIVNRPNRSVWPGGSFEPVSQVICERSLAICPVGHVSEPVQTVIKISNNSTAGINQVGEIA